MKRDPLLLILVAGITLAIVAIVTAIVLWAVT